MQRILSILLVLAVCATPVFADAIIGQDLQNAMNTERGELQVIITLKKEAEVTPVRGADKAQILDILAQECAADQHFVKGLCEKLQSEGAISKITQFQMSNCIAIKATASAIQELALHDDIYTLSLDAPQVMINPIAGEDTRNTWGLNHIRASQNKGYKGSGIVVGVVDTGIQMNHPGFGAGQVITGLCKSYVNGEPTANDGNGHGTHCAGTVVSPKYGVATGAKVFGVKVLGASGSGTWEAVASGVEYAAKHADVISMSLGGTEGWSTNPVETAVKNATNAGVVCSVACGNSGPGGGTVGTPGCAPEVITVGAIQQGGGIASFSSRGPTNKGYIKPEVVAPGVNVMSLWINSGTRSISGTSMATPHVSGVLAVLLSANRSLSPAALKKILTSTAKGKKQANVYGEGCVDVPDALGATFALMEMGIRGDMNTMRLEKEIEVDIVDGKVEFAKDIYAPFSATIVGVKSDFSCDNANVTLNGNVILDQAVKAGEKVDLKVKVKSGDNSVKGTAATQAKNGKGTITVYISLW